MSMNFHIYAVREMMVVKTGEIVEEKVFYDGIEQTPTTITNQIMSSDDRLNAYYDYVLDRYDYYVDVPIFDAEDHFCESPH